MAATLGVATLETDVDLKGLDKGLGQAKTKSKSTWSKMGDAAIQQFGFSAADAAMMAVNAVKEFAAESIAEFQTFEKQASEVFTLMPGMSQSAMESMKSDVLAFSAEVGRTTDETLPALYQAISAGVPSDDVFSFMQIASDAALGGVTDLETAVDGITSVVNAYGAETIDAAAASDVMFTAVKLGKTDFTQLSSSLFNVIPTAASLGVSFEDVAASMAVMTGQGTPTSVATTQLRAALVEASKGGTKLDNALRNLTGKSFAALISEGKTSSEIFNELRGSMPEQEFKDLFGSVEALNAVLGITGPNAGKTEAALAEMADAAGATAAAAATMSETMEQLENRVTASTEAMKIQTGQALEPLKTGWLKWRLQLNETVGATAAMTGAMREGDVSILKGAAALLNLAGGGTMAIDVMRDLESTTAEMSTEISEISEAAAAYDQVLTGNVGTISEAAYETLNLVEANRNVYDGLTETNEQLEYAALVARDYTEAGVELEFGQDALAEAEQRRAEAAEEAAEAMEAQAQAQAELAAKTGEYFTSALEAGNAQKFYNESLDELAASGETATVNQDSINQSLFDSIAASGASAESLAILGGALGLYSEEAVNAALQTALIQAKIDEVAASWDGTAEGAAAMQTEIASYAAQLATLDTASTSTAATTGQFDQATGAAGQTAIGTTENLAAQVEQMGALDAANESGSQTTDDLTASLADTGTQAADTTAQVGDYVTVLGTVPADVSTTLDLVNFSTVHSDTQTLVNDFNDLASAAQAAASAISNIPTSSSSSSSSTSTSSGFQTGGFTGVGPAAEYAGLVHYNELVVPPDVWQAGAGAIVDFAQRHLPGAAPILQAGPAPVLSGTPSGTSGSAGGNTYYIDARNATDPAGVELAVERAMSKAGVRADQRRRS